MTRSDFVYVTYISAAPQRVWDALIAPEFTRKYWGHVNLSDWKPGSAWEHRDADGVEVKLVGKVVEFDPPRRMVLTWAEPEDTAKPSAHSRVTIVLEPIDDMVKLTITHDQLVPGSDMQRGIEEGWPRVLSSLKSFLETGKPLPTWAKVTR
jgi:uncharacterized protein YndB with AHSA1/START domain